MAEKKGKGGRPRKKIFDSVNWLKEHPEDISIMNELEEIRQKRLDLRKHKNVDAVGWLQQHPEDIPMARENLAARDRGYDDDGIRHLFAAVCLRACVDYKSATMGRPVDKKDPDWTVDDCKRFFRSEIFQYFINRVPPEEVERTIRATPKDAIQNIWSKNEKEQKEVAL